MQKTVLIPISILDMQRRRYLQGFAGIYCDSQGLAGHCRNLQEFAGVCRDLQGFARLCRDVQGSAGLCRDLQGFAGICRDLQGLAGSGRDLQGFAGLCRDLHGFAGICKDSSQHRLPCVPKRCSLCTDTKAHTTRQSAKWGAGGVPPEGEFNPPPPACRGWACEIMNSLHKISYIFA